MRRYGALIVLIILATMLVPGVVTAKKPPPDPEPDPDPAIAYTESVRIKGTYTTRLMVMNADGSNRTEVWSRGGSGTIRSVDWSPDGDKLVFASFVDGSPGIFTINLDGTGLTQVIETTLIPDYAVWSPAPVPGAGDDEYRIAYTVEDSSGVAQLHLVDLAGDDPITLTSDSNSQCYPTWSPDGDRLAFKVRVHGSTGTIKWGIYDFTESSYTEQDFAIAGETVTQAYAPDWAKTQDDKIAWTVSISGETSWYTDIWILDVEGDDSSYPRRLTSSANLLEEYPSWSPDDQQMVFLCITYENGRATGLAYEVMDADGTDREEIGPGHPYVKPVWRRNLDWSD